MNQNLHSPTKLTEFARDFDDEPDTLFGRFVYKIQNVYNQSYNSVNDLPNNNNNNNQSYNSVNDLPNNNNNNNNSNNNNNNNNNSSSSNTTPTDITQNSRNSISSTSSSGMSSSKPQPPNTLPLNVSVSVSVREENQEDKNDKDIVQSSIEATEGRTMVNVLKRISNLMASKNNDLRDYKDTDLHKLWMPDAKAKECYDCAQRFNTFRRKHHCRLCGQIFCSKCCNQVVPGKIILCSGDLKVCNYCSKIVLSYLKSPNITVDLHSDLQALQQDLCSKLEECANNDDKLNILPTTSCECSPRRTSVGYQEERFATQHVVNNLSEIERKNILQQSHSLITLHEEMSKTLPVQNCGTELIEFLQKHNKSSNKMQAVAILCAMLAAGFLQPLVPDSEEIDFDENLHYKFNINACKSQDLKLLRYNDLTENIIIRSTAGAQFDVSANEPQPPKSIESHSLNYNTATDADMESTMLSSSITTKLLEAYCEHEEQLLAQMLRSFHLDLRWSKVLLPLCCGAANHFKSEYCTNDLMDIRNYVNFKKVPGGKRQECTIVGGAVFSKNVAHKDMATRVEMPRVLLLQCAIVYERIEGKFVSISTVVLQEKEYLRNVCARIMSFKPNIVLVHKNVAGVAQDILRSHGITLVLDVKLSVLERLSRTLQCDILTSIESNISKPRLGLCDVFYIQSFNDGAGSYKTLMFFEKLNSPRGYTCLLRGGHNYELKQVKKVAAFLIYARFNWRLEMSFLLDEFAQAQEPKPTVFDTQEADQQMENSQMNSVTKKRNLERKPEKKYLKGISENVPENMDPLRCCTDTNNTAVLPNNSEISGELATMEVEKRYDNRFRNALNSTILSTSPFVNFPLPYLETEQGRKCALRELFPAELYYSKQWSNMERSNENMEITQNNNNNNKSNYINKQLKLNAPHDFLTLKITKPANDRVIQKLLAEFRAMGCRYPKRNELFKLAMLAKEEEIQKPQKLCDNHVYKDALDLENHQRLPVLFCSFYYNQKTGSSFCAPPTLLNMKFYGQQDIMLGQFLQRYCCRLSAICPLCNLPMLNHVRRYVHSMGCVQVFLSEDIMKTDPNRIFFTAWCSICNVMTPSVPLSETSKCLSLAKYLELRFHAHSYRKRVIEEHDDKNALCQHSLHRDYIHYFSYRGVGAKFNYKSIDVWEIGLPSLRLKLQIPKIFDRFQVLDDVKNFSMKGHEIFTSIHERIADLALEDENSPLVTNLKSIFTKDQLYFKRHVETVQNLLTDNTSNIYDINDAILMAKRVLCESLEQWEPRVHDIAVAQKHAAKQQSQQQSITATTTQLPLDEHHTMINNNNNVETAVAVAADDISPSLSNAAIEDAFPAQTEDLNVDEGTTTTQNTNNVEKKSIKKMLIHLLPSMVPAVSLQSPFNNQEHYTLPLGVFPILVHDQDLSSIIAYSLTSMDYQRAKSALSEIPINNNNNNVSINATTTEKETAPQLNNNNSPFLKPKIQDNAHDNDGINVNEEERSKTKSQNSHIDITFQDNITQFSCRIYFPKEFDVLRAKTLQAPALVSVSLSASDESNGKQVGDETSNVDACRYALARSLCSSVQWEARGGKSGSRFCKTLDDRFVLKEMSKGDVNKFENFAPNYFDYIEKSQQQNEPTLLAKIFGVFKVIIKKKDSFLEKTVLVMENLFYNLDIKNKFDLKGSERNRHVNPTEHDGETVLLDENLVQMSWLKPLYILSHSKVVLKNAINRDSTFLEKNQVMDYSLLVGLDNQHSVLVLGIIDYIRTFTFDKKVESFVKQTGILGGGVGKLPTVISPERYKMRFIDAMDRYFYTVPDRWEGLSKS